MLLELEIKNFAVIEHQAFSFAKGLNVITGESGAGKSVILHALELVLGGKPKPHLVREGSEGFEVQALFSLENLESDDETLKDLLKAKEVVILRSGVSRSRVHINGRLTPLQTLRSLSLKLVNICGQSEYVELLNPRMHLNLLDRYAGNAEILEKFRQLLTKYREVRNSLSNLSTRNALNLERQLELQKELILFTQVKLTPNLREELEARIKVLSAAERVLGEGEALLATLTESSTEETSLIGKLKILSGKGIGLSRLDERALAISELLATALRALIESETLLQELISGVELNDIELEECRARLGILARLERKYQVTGIDLVEEEIKLRTELNDLDTGPIQIIDLERELTLIESKLQKLGRELTDRRSKGAITLSHAISAELAELGMGSMAIEVSFTPLSQPALQGYEVAEFLLRRGKSALPLSDVASGGELSRLTLVLKNVLRAKAGVDVLVFDEVDTGVSGSIARAVGLKLKTLAHGSQVICITHLPQVASLADHHMLVEKKISNLSGEEISSASVRELNYAERIDEVARMLSGYKITAAARESARELLAGE
jgi:DNA repair protein RecN (Recombination protein N)